MASISNYPEHLDLDSAPVYSMPLKLLLLPFRLLNFEHNIAKKCIQWHFGSGGGGSCGSGDMSSVSLHAVMNTNGVIRTPVMRSHYLHKGSYESDSESTPRLDYVS